MGQAQAQCLAGQVGKLKGKGLHSRSNKYCRHRWEMIHLFNVPFPKWNPCNPTKPGNLTVYISRTPFPQWNLIRAKTVYSCLDSDIYWKWPLVKVIANAWKGSAMRPWRLSVPRATQTEPGMLMGWYIKRDALHRHNFHRRASKANSENLSLRVKAWYSAEAFIFKVK